MTEDELAEMKLRFDMGVTQTRLARDFGVTQGWVSQLAQRGFKQRGDGVGRGVRLASTMKVIKDRLLHAPRVALTEVVGGDRSAGRWLRYHAQEIADELGVSFVVGHERSSSYWQVEV